MVRFEFDYLEVERIVYIWGRYAGTRDATPEGKHYSKFEIKELIARLERFMKNPDSFDEGFEKTLEEDEDDPNRELSEYPNITFEGKEFKIKTIGDEVNYDTDIKHEGSWYEPINAKLEEGEQ